MPEASDSEAVAEARVTVAQTRTLRLGPVGAGPGPGNEVDRSSENEDGSHQQHENRKHSGEQSVRRAQPRPAGNCLSGRRDGCG